MKHAILLKPNNNIPFFEELKKMCIYEATIVFTAIGLSVEHMSVKGIGQGHYLFFETEQELSEFELNHIEKLSFYYTYFEVRDGLLKPHEQIPMTYFGEDLSNRLKYNGKTNETFTRMILNLAVYSSKFYKENCLSVFDPVCGRGTSLFEAMIRGHHGYGAEQDKRAVSELGQYFQRYLKEGRYKHQVIRGRALHQKTFRRNL